MSAADIERLRKGFEAFARGDLERAFANISDDFQVIDHVILEDTSGRRGPEALAANVAQVQDAFERVSWEMLETIDLDGRVLVRVRAIAHSARGGGLETRLEAGQLWTIRDGLASRLEIFPSWEEARAAAGLDL